MKIKARLDIKLIDKKGRVVDSRICNPTPVITTDGFDALCAQIGTTGSQPAAFKYIAIGTGTNAPAVGDTALQTEVARAAGTYAHTNDTKIFTLTYTWVADHTAYQITEAGMFNAASGVTLLVRDVFTALNWTSGLSLSVTWTITLAQA